MPLHQWALNKCPMISGQWGVENVPVLMVSGITKKALMSVVNSCKNCPCGNGKWK